MAKQVKKAQNKKADSVSGSKLFAFIAIFLNILGFLIALVAKRDDKYVMFYAKQSLVLFIASIVIWVAGIILFFIPIIGWLVIMIAWIILFVVWLIALVNSVSGEQRETPILGKYMRNIKI